MLLSYKRSQTSVVFRVKILDSSATDGSGLTGLAYNTAGLIISTIADNEATATAYTVTGSTIETIATLGTYAAPTATKCRFREVDSTNHPGVYEIQLADARFAVASAKSLIVSISGAADCAETDVLIPLVDLDPYDSVRAGLTALPNAAADAAGGLPISDAGGLDMDGLGSDVGATYILADALPTLAEILAADVDSTGTPITLAKAIEVAVAILTGAAAYESGTGIWTVKGRDGATTIVQQTLTDEGDRDAPVIS